MKQVIKKTIPVIIVMFFYGVCHPLITEGCAAGTLRAGADLFFLAIWGVAVVVTVICSFGNHNKEKE